MAIALVQSATGNDGSPTLPGAVASGGLVIIAIGALNGTHTVTGFTDVAGFKRLQSGDVGVMLFRKYEASGSSGAYTASGSVPWIIAEFSGVGSSGVETAIDSTQDGDFPGGAAHWTDSLTTPGSGEVLVVSAFAWNNQSNVDGTWDSPFTNVGQLNHIATTKRTALGYHVDATDNGSYTSGMTNTTPSISFWGHIIASYGGGGGGGSARSQGIVIA